MVTLDPMKFRALPVEILTSWNDAWPQGSNAISVKQLMKSLQMHTEKEMDTVLRVVPYELGVWLLKNGWTKQEPRECKRWTKHRSSIDATRMGGASAKLESIQGSQIFSTRHRPWYIDFKNDSLKLSSLTYTKNVIFEKTTKTGPEVYWDLRYIAETLNVDSEEFKLKQWLAYHNERFETLRKEFNFDLVTLQSCQQKDAHKNRQVAKKRFTQKTLLSTIGLITMLLQWATSTRITQERQTAAKAIMVDLLRRIFDGVEDINSIRTWCTDASAPQISIKKSVGTSQTTLALNEISHQTSGEDVIKGKKAMHQRVTGSLLYLFANRENHQHLHALLIHGLNILDSAIETAIVNGKVGQISPVFPPMWLESEVHRAVDSEQSPADKRKMKKDTDGPKTKRIRSEACEARLRHRIESGR